MTKTWREGEAWLAEDGAPIGPTFSFVIPSSRNGHGPYRLYRDGVTGTILHQPKCEAWEHGHHRCRHVTESIARAERPAQAFLEDVLALRGRSVWWASPDAMRDFCTAVIRRAEDALDQQREIAEFAERANRPPVSVGEAVEEMGG